MRPLLTATFAMALAVAGCGEGPSGVVPLADYELVSIDGQPLPAPFSVLSDGRVVVGLLESRLQLLTGNRGVETGRKRTPLNNPGARTFRYEDRFTYTVNGTAIEITYACNDHASCLPGPDMTGRLEADGVVFDHTLGRAPLQYRKR